MDFQKSIALLQVILGNPITARAFMVKYSADKHIRKMMQYLNVNPDDFLKDLAEQEETAQEMQEVAALAQITGPGGGAGLAEPGAEGGGAPIGGGSGEAARVNQMANPLTGMPGNI